MAENRQTATVHPSSHPRNPATEQPPPLCSRRCLIPFMCLSSLFIAMTFLSITMSYFFPDPPYINCITAKSSTTLSTITWNLTFEVENPNIPSKIFFDYFDVLLSYESKLIAETKLGPFVVSRMGMKVLYANLSISSKDVRKGVVKKMIEDQKHGSVLVQIRVLYARKFMKDQKWTLASWIILTWVDVISE